MLIDRKYIIPVCASEEYTEADLLSHLGIQENAEPAQEEEQTEQIEQTEENAPSEGEQQQEPEQQPEEPKDQKPQPQTKPQQKNRADEAFAAMRIENKKLNSMISDLAAIIGVNSKDPNVIASAVQEQILQAKSKQQGIPADILKKIQDLEEANQYWTKEQARMQAYRGFQMVKDQFGISDAELNTFADELVASNLNPFEGGVDVVKEYKLRNFDKLIQQAVDRGIREEQERAAKASNASTPSKQQGTAPTAEPKITSISELSAWLDAQSK